MKKKFPAISLSIACVAFLLLLVAVFGKDRMSPDMFKSMFAGFFAEKLTTEQLKEDYVYAIEDEGSKKIKILIAPGHNESSPGAAFLNLREVDMTAELGEEIFGLFKNDDHYEAVLLRGKNGDHPDFTEYFNRERENIARVRDRKRAQMKNYISDGLIRKEEPIPHVTVPEETSLRLYGINMWADEIGASIVLNLHFNDYPRKRINLPGEYSGFSIYIPYDEYGNARVSEAIAEKVLSRLLKYYFVSTYPKEGIGIIPDWELISLGANDTLKAASLLIEYGYIYEPQFKYSQTRKVLMRDMALKTYLGVQDFFGGTSTALSDTAILPYLWDEDISQGDEGKVSVLALQAALASAGFYPPLGKTRDDCPLTGVFKECTRSALASFQENVGVSVNGSIAGPKTRESLNNLFGR